MANKHTNRCATTVLITEMKIKNYEISLPIRIAKINMTNHAKCWGVCEGSAILIHY